MEQVEHSEQDVRVMPMFLFHLFRLFRTGGWNGTDKHGELAVVEGAQRLEQPTADRDLFPLMREVGARNGRESVTGAPWRGRNSLAVELP